MQISPRNLLMRLILPPGVVLLLVTLYVPTRFVAPEESQRLTVRGQPADVGLEFPCRVLVWNIYKGDRSQFSADMTALSADCDVLLLQEYHANDRVQRSLDALTSHAFQIATSFLYRSDGSATGVATGAVVPARSPDCFITTDTEPVSGTPKATLVCEYDLAGSDDRLLVINMHAINVAGLRAFQNQLEQVRGVLDTHSGPVLLAGDFNTNTIAKQAYLREFAESFELVEMQFSADSRTTSPLLNLPIDYVFSRGVVTSQSQVAGSLDGSDHKAITFQIDGLSDQTPSRN